MYLYKIEIHGSDRFYIGITNNLDKRKASHRQAALRGKKTPLYDLIRKYETFELKVISKYNTREKAGKAERRLIRHLRTNGEPLLNLANGGDGGFSIQNLESWKKKLSSSRKGRKPALGMKHTEQNKKLFSKVSREHWDNQKTYDAEEISKYSHKEAKRIFGISTTHYYRLKKRIESSDLD